MICFSETWLDDTDSNSLYELPNYISKHQIKDDRKGGGVSFYIHNSLSFRVLPNLCINSTDIESLSIEISLNDQLNTLVNVLYRPPSGKIEPFENFLSKLLSSVQNSNKNLHIAGDFNLNLLDHESNKKVHDFLNIIYRNSMTPTINKPTRVTRKTNYANIAWGNTYRTKLKTIHYHQKHAARIVFDQDKLTHSRPLLRSLNALNVYQINLYQHLNFMHKVNNNVAPIAFHEIFTNLRIITLQIFHTTASV